MEESIRCGRICPDQKTTFVENKNEPITFKLNKATYKVIRNLSARQIIKEFDTTCSYELEKFIKVYGLDGKIPLNCIGGEMIVNPSWLTFALDTDLIKIVKEKKYIVEQGDTFQIDGYLFIASRVVIDDKDYLNLIDVESGCRWSQNYLLKNDLESGNKEFFESLIGFDVDLDEVYNTRNKYKVVIQKNY
jgi:hypothetical protein